jgi:hypothetical protein
MRSPPVVVQKMQKCFDRFLIVQQDEEKKRQQLLQQDQQQEHQAFVIRNKWQSKRQHQNFLTVMWMSAIVAWKPLQALQAEQSPAQALPAPSPVLARPQ